jgi:hypothetical protein
MSRNKANKDSRRLRSVRFFQALQQFFATGKHFEW